MSRMGDMAVLSDRTIEVLRGRATVPSEFAELARWVEERYGTPVVNVTLDVITAAHKRRDRIIVWVRTRAEAELFRSGANYDSRKQAAIAEHFGRPGIFVIVTDIDSDLRELAVRAVRRDEWDALAVTVAAWKIESFGARVTVFLNTDAEADSFRGTHAHTALDDAIWALVHEHDEFGVVPRATFAPVLDSKQNYDENFQGNGYYYYL